jgi:hypothetical protein
LRKLSLFIYLLFSLLSAQSQLFTASNLLEVTKVAKDKMEKYLFKQGFNFIGTEFKGDTIAREYQYKPLVKKGKKKDSVDRSITYFSLRDEFSFIFYTSSADEGLRIKNEFKKDGFFSNNENDSFPELASLYQRDDITAVILSKTIDSLTEFSFHIRKQKLPKPKEIVFAEDLFVFNSHEYLRYYFGDDNVKKDFYFFSEDKLIKCSVLFPNTNRQVVFLWDDEVNNCNIAKLFIGGQLRTGSAIDYNRTIAENIWQLKSGIHPGMSLYTLRMLNDAAFNFYGGSTAKAGMVFTDSTGKINFKKENIILGCINCTDADFLKKAVFNSDEALEEERILFVHTIILQPDKKNVTVQRLSN